MAPAVAAVAATQAVVIDKAATTEIAATDNVENKSKGKNSGETFSKKTLSKSSIPTHAETIGADQTVLKKKVSLASHLVP